MTTACYLRVSSRGQADANGADAQRLIVNRWLAAQGTRPDEAVWFEDEAVSGKRMRRPEFDRLQEQIRTGAVKTVVVYSLSRTARNVRGLLAFIDLCRENSVRVVSVKEAFDLNTPVGKLIVTIIGAVDEMEAERIQERIVSGLEARRERGAKLGPAYRYRPDVRETCRSMRAAGARVRAVMDATGVSRSTLYAILREPAAVIHNPQDSTEKT